MKFEDLVQSYGNCLYPAFTILVDAKGIDQPPQMMQISLSLQKKANAATIRYVVQKEPELLQLQKQAKLGTVVEIKLGYDKKQEGVFYGYLHTVEVQQKKDCFILELYAQDVLGLMMNHQRLIHLKKKTPQQAMESIIKDSRYQAWIKKKQIMTSADPLPCFTQWGMSDFDTLERICKEKQAQFYMRYQTLIVEPSNTALTPEIKFSNFGLQEISLTSCAAHLYGKVQLLARDQKQTTLAKEQKVTLGQLPVKAQTFQNCAKVMHLDGIWTKDQLTSRSKQLADAIQAETATIFFSGLYVPELCCGRKLDFTGISCIKKSCMLSELEISYDHNSFHCEGTGIVLSG